MQKLKWHSEVRKVKDLALNKDNPRKMSKEGLNTLKERIRERGYHGGIVVDTDGVILSGNHGKRALEELGIEEVITILPDRRLSEDERKKVILESNLHDGVWDLDILKSSFELDIINSIGFDDIVLDQMWESSPDNADDEWDDKKELAKIKKPITKLGDTIFLGRHKIVCGDSSDPEVLKKLFGDKRASAIYSDPIYNINLNYNKGLSGRQNYGGSVHDNRSPEEYRRFIKKGLECALAIAEKDVHVFYWNDQSQIGLIQQIYAELSIENKRVCIWIKNGQNPTPGVAFSKCYEPVIYGVRGRPHLSRSLNKFNEILNKEFTTGNNIMEETLDHLDIWATKRLPGKDYEHATSKPPSLHDKPIRRCTKPGDIILDSFLGSASTLISAERLGRIVYGVELEPVFCDLAIRRFEKATGLKAKIIHQDEERQDKRQIPSEAPRRQ